MSYPYWNDFINNWRNLPSIDYTKTNPFLISGWENPNTIPLMNITGRPEFSLEYLPEPWWGNDGNSPLNSVIINYNPGQAEPYKHYTNPLVKNLYNCSDYGSFLKSEVTGFVNTSKGNFPRTNHWHWKNRAKIVFDTCQRLRDQLNGNNQLCNHLSIELIPWHTRNTKNIQTYVYRNLKQIYLKNIVFAADQSCRIVNKRLRNKVIVRSCYSTFLVLLNQIRAQGIDNYSPTYNTTTHTSTGNGSYFKFYFDNLPDVEFICIWGKTSRNKFPPDVDMDCIL